MTVRLTHDSSVDARLVLFRLSEFACVKMRVVLRRKVSIEHLLYSCTVHYRTHWYSVELAQKSRALLYSDLVRQTNRHASSESSCVKRTVIRRQPSEYDINSTVSLFLLFGPSCVNRHASKYELALRVQFTTHNLKTQ